MTSSDKPRVLIPSDFQNWVDNFVYGYEKLGWQCDTGCDGFENVSDEFDVVHLNWPEELVGWNEPDPAKIQETKSLLSLWREKSKIILTVNNLYPHGAETSAPYRELYEAFYDAAHVIHHQSRHSHAEVIKRHPEVADKIHVVTSGFNYDPMLKGALPDRETARGRLGLNSDKVVIFLFGAIRFASELRLVRRAYQRAKLPNAVFVSAINFAPKSSEIVRWRYEVYQWRKWLRRNNFKSLEGYIPDQQVADLFQASDALIVARSDSLTSGLPCLAMTYGRTMVAPDTGSIAEYLKGTYNPMYTPGDARSLALALESFSSLDQSMAERTNRARADAWGWENIIAKCLEKLPARSGHGE